MTPLQTRLLAVLIAAVAAANAAHAQPGVFLVDPTQPLCKLPSATPLDCTFVAAQAYARAHKQPVEVRLGPGTFETATGLQQIDESPYTVDIHGAGKGEFGGGTIIRLTAPLTSAVISYPFRKRTAQGSSFWSNLNLQGFTIDANGKAPMCFDLNALRIAHLNDLSCTGATGPRSWMRIGGYPQKLGGTIPEGYTGGSFQVMASDIFLYHNGFQPEAVVEADIAQTGDKAGVITGYRIPNAGRFREPATVPVFLKGPDAATAPCRKMPTGVTGHLSPDPAHPGFQKLTSITQTSGGEGCTLPIHITAVDLPAAAYGFEIEATDSSFYDLTDDSVGRVAGIEDRVSGKALFVHPHVWNTWGGMDLWGGETVLTPEFDSLYGYGVFFRYGSGSVVMDPTFVYLPGHAFASVADFLFAPGATNMSISGQQCETPTPNPGYVQFVGQSGALDFGNATATTATEAHGPHRVFPFGFRATDIAACTAPTHLAPGTYVTTTPLSGTSPARTLSWSGGSRKDGPATAFLLAELPTPTADAAGLRLTTLSTAPGQAPTQQVIAFSNSATPIAACLGLAPGPAAGASIHAYADPNGPTKIYAWLPAGTSIAVTLDLIQGLDTHLEPAPPQVLPTGAPVFDSAQCH